MYVCSTLHKNIKLRWNNKKNFIFYFNRSGGSFTIRGHNACGRKADGTKSRRDWMPVGLNAGGNESWQEKNIVKKQKLSRLFVPPPFRPQALCPRISFKELEVKKSLILNLKAHEEIFFLRNQLFHYKIISAINFCYCQHGSTLSDVLVLINGVIDHLHVTGSCRHLHSENSAIVFWFQEGELVLTESHAVEVKNLGWN